MKHPVVVRMHWQENWRSKSAVPEKMRPPALYAKKHFGCYRDALAASKEYASQTGFGAQLYPDASSWIVEYLDLEGLEVEAARRFVRVSPDSRRVGLRGKSQPDLGKWLTFKEAYQWAVNAASGSGASFTIRFMHCSSNPRKWLVERERETSNEQFRPGFDYDYFYENAEAERSLLEDCDW
jgi:hypothetical protein